MAKRRRLIDELEEEELEPEEIPDESLIDISFYSYIQKKYGGKRTGKGKLAQELAKLAEEQEEVKRIGTEEELIAVAESIEDIKIRAEANALIWEEYLTATGQW